jgi:hypothetical protein
VICGKDYLECYSYIFYNGTKTNDYIILEAIIAIIRLSTCSCCFFEVKLSTSSSNLTKDAFFNFSNQDLDL